MFAVSCTLILYFWFFHCYVRAFLARLALKFNNFQLLWIFRAYITLPKLAYRNCLRKVPHVPYFWKAREGTLVITAFRTVVVGKYYHRLYKITALFHRSLMWWTEVEAVLLMFIMLFTNKFTWPFKSVFLACCTWTCPSSVVCVQLRSGGNSFNINEEDVARAGMPNPIWRTVYKSNQDGKHSLGAVAESVFAWLSRRCSSFYK